MSDSDSSDNSPSAGGGLEPYDAEGAARELASATPDADSPGGNEWTIPISVGVMQLAGLTSIGAGAIHAAAAGQHGEVTSLARLFVAVAAAQLGVGLLALVRGGRLAATLTVVVNAVSVGAWAATRLWDINWVAGLENREDPQFMDTACAALGAIAVLAAVVALAGRRTAVSRARIGVPGLSVGVIAVVAMLVGANHSHADGGHSHDEAAATAPADPAVVAGGASALATSTAAADHEHAEGEAAEGEAAEGEHAEGDAADGHEHATAEPAAVAGASEASPTNSAWPRAWDPAVGLDFSGVAGVTRDQQLRAAALVNDTLRDLPAFSDVTTLDGLGYSSIGDSGTGFEHFINYDYIGDDKELDPTAPESLVFRVDGAERTLVSAMFIIADTPVDDPRLADYGGPLMQWHTHENLCWTLDSEGTPKVAGVADVQEDCPAGSVLTGGGNPMVHVWITPHECGPFAALEGHGAGQTGSAEGARTDQCAHGHDDSHGDAAAADSGEPSEDPGAVDEASAEDAVEALATPQAWDPTLPINLSGTDGVTPEQQAFAENLVASNLTDLPQWADPAVAEAAGFHSIGDAATGHEHFINWDWINDDVYLDPDFPESLVYEPQPDGSRKLVSAMYMLPDDMTLDEVPDWGGALMQWHVHSDLCFNMDTDAPRVAGLTDAQGQCTPPLEKLPEAPMIHVWLTPNPCGPFAALEGVGAGQVAEGEEHLCDEAHGSH